MVKVSKWPRSPSPVDDLWNKEQTLKLIEQFRKYPCLYNPFHPQYTSILKRNEIINLFVVELRKIKSDVTTDSIKAQLAYFKRQMSHEKKRFLRTQKKATKTKQVYLPNLWCYNELLFLQDCKTYSFNPDKTKITPDHTKESKEENHPKEEQECVEKDQDKKTDSKKKNATVPKQKKSIRNASPEVTPAPKKHRPVDVFSIEVFTQCLCDELKHIQLKETFDDVQLEILELLAAKIKAEKIMLGQED